MNDVFGLLNSLGSFALYPVAFVFVLTIIVFIHELGHFLAARFFGVRVESFSIGFGKELFGWNDRYGTRWRISALPLGGYVKFWGDADVATARADEEMLARASAAERAGSFHHKPLYAKSVIAAAGPIANFLLAIVVFALTFMVMGERMVPPRAAGIVEGSPAERAGLKTGDLVVSVNETKVASFSALVKVVTLNRGVPLKVVVDRGGRLETFTVTPELTEVDDGQGGKVSIPAVGIRLDQRLIPESEITQIYYGPFDGTLRAAREVYYHTAMIVTFLRDLVTGQGDVRQLSGPLGIAKISGDIAHISPLALIQLIAVLSISIGLLNLLPIPILDGGHLLYYAIEGISGKPLGERAQEIGLQIGLGLVLGLLILASWNDLVKLRLFGGA